jgi:hypothetical protein
LNRPARGTELFSVLNDWRKNGLVAPERLAQRYGAVVCAKFPGRRGYLLNHPDYIRRVLIDNRGNYLKPSASKTPGAISALCSSVTAKLAFAAS